MLVALVRWAVNNRLVVCLLTAALVAVGTWSFLDINVEAYPDPAPAIVEVIAQVPGASAEEVERNVTTPLEVALAGMPGLKSTRSKSLFGLAHLRNQFDYETSYKDARIETLNRLALADLPTGVQPKIAPTSPVGEIYRYVLQTPVDEAGKPIYDLVDLKSLQDWTLTREFRRVDGVADVVSFGGRVKRYEIQPDPDRLRRFDISLDELERAIAASNLNAGGDYLLMPHSVQVVRGLGLLGDGLDPMTKAAVAPDPYAARNFLRLEELRRIDELRQIVLAATNNVPVRVGDVVEQGETEAGAPRGVVIGSPTRMGRVALSLPAKNQSGEEIVGADGQREWNRREDVVQGVVLLRKGERSLPTLTGVHAKVAEINSTPGKLPPGVKIELFDDRTNLIHRTTETVNENLVVGMVLVTAVMWIFLGDFKAATIVATNIPLALLFAFSALYLRGKSANLLSLGAVDFGIIVDSTVILVERVHRALASGEDAGISIQERITKAAAPVQRSLFFSTVIMVCALLPLFTMAGPEGRIFGPMADAYAFALGGALLLALTLSPVLCRMILWNVRGHQDNVLVRTIEALYLRQLDIVMRWRWVVVIGFALLAIATAAALPFLGREFMPALEEGNVYIRGTFPAAVSLDEVSAKVETARQRLERYPEARAVLSQIGRPDDGTDPTGFFNAELFVPLKNEDQWPKMVPNPGWRAWFSAQRARTKDELTAAMQRDLDDAIAGVDWNFSQAIRDNVMETLSGVKGENSVKIFGPDLAELESLADQVASELRTVRGVESVGVFSIMGQTNLEFMIDREKCARWNVSVADVQEALATAVGGKAFTRMVEGERTFDITLRWPEGMRGDEDQILDIPVDVLRNRVVVPATTVASGDATPDPSGSADTAIDTQVPRRRLRDLVTPVREDGIRDPKAPFTREGASTISREQGQRLIAVKFGVRGRDLASTVAEAQSKCGSLVRSPYRIEWSGEFEEMQSAIERLATVAALAMVLVLVLLYLAMGSVLDVAVVSSNVLVICMGGVWALFATGTNFNISAGVGFISILGVGMMNGLLLVASFNSHRKAGKTLDQAIREGIAHRVRPLTMTSLAACLGMLPAALATRIGSQTQKPLAIVVVGGMLCTLLFLNLIPALYSLYGDREPPDVAGVEH